MASTRLAPPLSATGCDAPHSQRGSTQPHKEKLLQDVTMLLSLSWGEAIMRVWRSLFLFLEVVVPMSVMILSRRSHGLTSTHFGGVAEPVGGAAMEASYAHALVHRKRRGGTWASSAPDGTTLPSGLVASISHVTMRRCVQQSLAMAKVRSEDHAVQAWVKDNLAGGWVPRAVNGLCAEGSRGELAGTPLAEFASAVATARVEAVGRTLSLACWSGDGGRGKTQRRDCSEPRNSSSWRGRIERRGRWWCHISTHKGGDSLTPRCWQCGV